MLPALLLGGLFLVLLAHERNTGAAHRSSHPTSTTPSSAPKFTSPRVHVGASLPTHQGIDPTRVADGPTQYRTEIVAHLDDHEIDWWDDDCVRHGDDGDEMHTLKAQLDEAGRDDRIYRQLILPASMIRLSDLTKDDYAAAWNVIFGKVNFASYRNRDSEDFYFGDYRNDLQSDAEGMQIIGSVFSAIASFVPIVGTVVSQVANQFISADVSQLQKDAVALGPAQYWKAYAKAFDSLPSDAKSAAKLQYYEKLRAKPSNEDFVYRIGDDPQLVHGKMNLQTMYNASDSTRYAGGVPYIVHKVSADGRKFVLRSFLFGGKHAMERSLTPPQHDTFGPVVGGAADQGIPRPVEVLLRWSCAEMQGARADSAPTGGLRQRAMLRAYRLRAIDAIAASMNPSDDVDGLHSYLNKPSNCELHGSMFPPTDEDVSLTVYTRTAAVSPSTVVSAAAAAPPARMVAKAPEAPVVQAATTAVTAVVDAPAAVTIAALQTLQPAPTTAPLATQSATVTTAPAATVSTAPPRTVSAVLGTKSTALIRPIGVRSL